jgi:3-deoxy-D-manno-octulosonic-acid transferase
MLSEYDYKFSFYSKLEQTDSRAVIVDQLGVLFDLYDIASWVWVGGAVHHQVHNVLEPTIRGLPTAFGEKYLNSQEARELVAENLVLASSDPIQFANWLATKLPKVDHPLENYFRQKLGASDYIHKSLQSFQFNLQE